jgi:hypothetical protein
LVLGESGRLRIKSPKIHKQGPKLISPFIALLQVKFDIINYKLFLDFLFYYIQLVCSSVSTIRPHLGSILGADNVNRIADSFVTITCY